MTRLLLSAAVTALLVAGCTTTDLRDIDVSKAAPACARECTTAYSQCVSGGPSVGFKTETLGACKEALRLCVSTCPPSGIVSK